MDTGAWGLVAVVAAGLLLGLLRLGLVLVRRERTQRQVVDRTAVRGGLAGRDPGGSTWGIGTGDVLEPGGGTGGEPHRGAPPAVSPPVIDEDVQFSVFRPQQLAAGVWSTVSVYLHRSTPFVDPVQGPRDPVAEVSASASALFAGTPFASTRADAAQPLRRSELVTVTLDLPGVECNPPTTAFAWEEAVHEARFRVRAPERLVGTTVRGWARVWSGPLLVAESALAVPVVAAMAQPRAVAALTVAASTEEASAEEASAEEASADARPTVREAMRRYRKVFPSYAHDDAEIVAQFQAVAQATGDEFLRDVITLRSGDQWRPRLLALIEDADLFQLFWSSNSMRSPYCRQEWEHALALGRSGFIRPLYWQRPMPSDLEHDLPPAALGELHFAQYLVPQQPAPYWALDALANAGFGDPPAPAPAPMPRPIPPPIVVSPDDVRVPSAARPRAPYAASPRRARPWLVLAVAALVTVAALAVAWWVFVR